MALGKAECGAHVVNQALVRQTAQILEQVAVEAEIDAEHLGDTEREVAVRDGKEDRLGQQGAEFNDFMGVSPVLYNNCCTFRTDCQLSDFLSFRLRRACVSRRSASAKTDPASAPSAGDGKRLGEHRE